MKSGNLVQGPGLEEVAWYASQWADVYGFLQQRMKENKTLAKACLVVRYEEIIEATAPTINAPDYYQPGFTAEELELIQKLTDETAESYT